MNLMNNVNKDANDIEDLLINLMGLLINMRMMILMRLSMMTFIMKPHLQENPLGKPRKLPKMKFIWLFS